MYKKLVALLCTEPTCPLLPLEVDVWNCTGLSCNSDLLFLTSHSQHQGHLSAFRLVLQVAGGPDLGLDILQVGEGLVENLQLPLGGGG